MRLSPHLSFCGNCRMAFDRYQTLLGGEIVTMLTYGESPLADQVSSDWRDKIVHATLTIDDMTLSGADVHPDQYREPQGFSVLLDIEDTQTPSST